METPITSHLTDKDFDHVYLPSEDSFLLIDTLETDLNYIKELAPLVCVEIGSGSGVVITALAKTLNNSIFIATDINRFACNATRSTAEKNDASIDAIHCNLVDGLKPCVVDLLIFNPPYVPTTEEEHSHRQLPSSDNSIYPDLVYSWSGGEYGRRVIDEMLSKLNTTMSPNGVFYLLLLRENKPDEVMGHLKKLGFFVDIIHERRIPGEYLYTVRASRNQKNMLKC